ncbi:MAG TPA: translocation/assembly module TamB domain-containing protein [Polyangiaceae bacterium]|nr:translocation/assembly module TamB domain-containing protein [Polyangiaceae bacterium]
MARVSLQLPGSRFDLGRLLARLICAVLAFVGALPLAAGFLVRSEAVHTWAATETARIANQLLGIHASYRTEVLLWPMEIALADVSVDSIDPGKPAATATRIAVRPRLFPLLAGKLDAGDIIIDHLTLDLKLQDGKVQNVHYVLPKSNGNKPRASTDHAPFTTIAVTDAQVKLGINNTQIETGLFDFDVYAEAGPAFEISLALGASKIREELPAFPSKESTPDSANSSPPRVYEDALCQLEMRARISSAGLLMRRFALLGAADFDPAANTQAACKGSAEQPERVALRLSEMWVVPQEGKPPHIDGNVLTRVPSEIVSRFIPLRFQGWVGLTADVRYSGNTKLPELSGRFKSGWLQLDRYTLVEHSDGDIRLAADRIDSSHIKAGYADGSVDLRDIHVDPFAPGATISVKRGDNRNLLFPALMRDVGVTNQTIVNWDLVNSSITDFHGTLDPPSMAGELAADTRNFEIFDRSVHDPARRHVIGVQHATVRGTFAVRPDSVQFLDTHAEFGASRMDVSVKVGFNNWIALDVGDQSALDLADISPLLDIPMKGKASVGVTMHGEMKTALLTGSLAVQGFEFGGFPLGNIKHSLVEFQPLKVKFSNLEASKNNSDFVIDSGELNFDTDASVLAEAKVRSNHMDLRDFFSMWHFDEDPRWNEVSGVTQTQAAVRYVLGGKQDPCKGGNLQVNGTANFTSLDVFGEHYDQGGSRFSFNWLDPDAGHLGFKLDLPSLLLAKGTGRILGSVHVDLGGKLQANAVASSIPLRHLQSLGLLSDMTQGELGAVVEATGTLDEVAAHANVQVSPVKIGATTLPGSSIGIELTPKSQAATASALKTSCGRAKSPGFNHKEYDADAAQGIFHIQGSLFGDTVRLEDLTVTRQRHKHLTGGVSLNRFDLGVLGGLSGFDISKKRLMGTLSANFRFQDLPMDAPGLASASAAISSLSASYGGLRLQLGQATELTLAKGELKVPSLPLTVRTATLKGTTVQVEGSVNNMGAKPNADLAVALAPTSLAAFADLLPSVERVQGDVYGKLHLTGPINHLNYDGQVELKNGSLELRGSPLSINDVQVQLALTTGQLRVDRASMSVGGGTVALRGSAPLRGTELGDAAGSLTIRNVTFAPIDGVSLNLDADLDVQRKATSDERKANLPRITGDIRLNSFHYTRPVTMSADIVNLTQRGKQTHFEAYDPENDMFSFDVGVHAQKALRIDNNLLDADLHLDSSELTLSGTNQRFGARGRLRVDPGGHIRMRRSSFELREGSVEFDDPTQIAPHVDVTAVTEYRRYGNVSTTETTAGSGTGGQWLITLHAFGDADTLRVDLSSSPELSQDDIFLLLTLGLTRAELDQAQSARLGESVALEALGTLSGADEAVTSAIPVIDEFHFGSAYSSRTGQTEPTVTIGKRLSDRIRALVTSGLTDSREVRSNLEWQLNKKVSVEGSYDNVNDISSSSLGNLGADIRWRLEFE